MWKLEYNDVTTSSRKTREFESLDDLVSFTGRNNITTYKATFIDIERPEQLGLSMKR